MIKGKDVLMYVNVGGEWKPYLCSTDVNVRFGVERLTKTTKGSGEWRRYYSRKKEWSISFTGVAGVTEWGWVESVGALGDTMEVKLEFADYQENVMIRITGNVIMADLDITSPEGDFADFTHDIQGDGQPVVERLDIEDVGGLAGFDYSFDFQFG